MLLILALWKQRQVDLCEFEARLVYRMSSKIVRASYKVRDLVSEENRRKNHDE